MGLSVSTPAELCFPIQFEIIDQIGYIILNDPPENRMTMRFFATLKDIVDNIKSMDSINGLIICSKGRHFSSGADLKELTEVIKEAIESVKGLGTENYLSILDENRETFESLATLCIPVVAALHGVCIGSALELALCADVRVCEERTTLGLPEVSFGVMPGCGGTVRLTKLAGASVALDLILTGQLLSAEDAQIAGIADMVVARKQSVDIARKLICSAPKGSTKEGFREFVRSHL
jgi:enoyl-CoA hydratase/carnithine racemase